MRTKYSNSVAENYYIHITLLVLRGKICFLQQLDYTIYNTFSFTRVRFHKGLFKSPRNASHTHTLYCTIFSILIIIT